MKTGDKIYDYARERYGVVLKTGLSNLGPWAEYQPYQNGQPVGQPTVAQVTQLILLLWSIWEPLTQMVATVRDWLTPDPDRVAARIEARRIRKEAKNHLPK